METSTLMFCVCSCASIVDFIVCLVLLPCSVHLDDWTMLYFKILKLFTVAVHEFLTLHGPHQSVEKTSLLWKLYMVGHSSFFFCLRLAYRNPDMAPFWQVWDWYRVDSIPSGCVFCPEREPCWLLGEPRSINPSVNRSLSSVRHKLSCVALFKLL